MKHRSTPSQVVGLVALATVCWLNPIVLHAANNVAPPNIPWHNKATAQNRVWIMNGSTFAAEVELPATSDDLGWKMIGSGDFNGDGEPDLVWRNENTGQNAVWFMKGTVCYAGTLLQSADDRAWKMVGVADFSHDGKPDLLWQNVNLGQNAVWLMDGATLVLSQLITSAGDPNWRIVATGDLNRDGSPDIILRNISTGQIALWSMNGLTMLSGELMRSPNGTELTEPDQDWQIVGTADYNGDGRTDLLWRHATLGLNYSWYLNNNIVIGSGYLSRQEFNVDWRIASQDMADSTYRLQTAKYTFLRATPTLSPPSVALSFKLPAVSAYTTTLQRRLLNDANWTTIARGLTTEAYTDTGVTLGQIYEYRAYLENPTGGGPSSPAEHVCAALNAPVTEARGKIVLLVDRTLTNQIESSLSQLKQDLAGDGWSVLRYDVPRHIDDYSSATSFQTNAYNVTNVIKPLLRSAYNNDNSTRAVFIIGHVAIPYSGTFSSDGHNCGPVPYGPDHRGAWPADMFYGDLDGTWTDTTANLINCNFAEPNNVPGDGKFDQEGLPSPFRMRLAVGRIDFARLPVFTEMPPPGVAPVSEATLIQRYLNKDHQYRHKLMPCQTAGIAPAAMVYGHFHDTRDNPIFENASHTVAALTTSPTGLVVGDFALQRSRPITWGFLAGSGAPDRVNNSIPYLEHTAFDLANPANEPRALFYTILASFTGDWNLTTNNYLRSLTAPANSGLAAVWTRFGLWRTDLLGVGEPLGAALTRMVGNPKDMFYDMVRDLAILGDPTLRLHVLAPPTNLAAKTSKGKVASVQLSWTASETGAQYYVYRGPSVDGVFTRVSASPLSGTSFTDDAPVNRQKVYMVRALKPVTVGTGSYTNISQGSFATVN